jgi:dihydrofolate synthase / folylpolyglutamate synthase
VSYQETLNWLFSKLPMYQRQGAVAFKKDLNNTLALANYLGQPHKKFKSIHVAGTNGKGSTSHMMASVLQEAGYKVGLYTSPHLKDFRERIKVNGLEVSEEFVTDFVQENKTFLEAQGLSFFEMTVGMAFHFFAVQNVDIAVVEVGLGGRLDSTNILNPQLSVITNISLDHTQMLGETLQEIAFEKAGIIKPNIPVVIGEKQEEVIQVFIKKAASTQSDITIASESAPTNYQTDLKGLYQQKNLQTAIVSLRLLQNLGYAITDKNIEEGLLNVVFNTGLKGRWQVLGQLPKTICDTAHNVAGLKEVMRQLQDETFSFLHIVLGVVNDKNLEKILPLFPKKACYYFCKPAIPRGLDAQMLYNKACAYGLTGHVYKSVKEAYKAALQKAAKTHLIYIGGSTFVVAEVV